MNSGLPDINQRIKEVVDHYASSNVSRFVDLINDGLPVEEAISQQRFNRIFNIDTRTNKYPSVPIEIIVAVRMKFPDISMDWLIGGEGTMLKSEATIPFSLPTKTIQQETKKEHKTISYINDPAERIVPIDTFGNELIPITDLKVAAGGGIFNEDNFETMDNVQLPGRLIKGGYHICVRIRGDSMAPTLQDGSLMIIRLLDKSEWHSIKNEHIYAITWTNPDSGRAESILKRIKNRLKQGFLVCMSDNPDKVTNGNFTVQENELVNVWHAEWYLSAKMPNIHDQYYSRLQRLEDIVEKLLSKVK